MPKVSIIIPVYNVEQYLAKCLDSVCGQTYKDLEIICVNDCSPDNCAEILNKYAEQDDRIILVTREKNGGLSAARNSGLDAATGEYIYFIDSDDWIDLDYIEKMVDAIKNNDADIAINTSMIAEKNNISKPYFHLNHEENYNNFIKTKEAIENILWSACTKIIRTSFLKKYNLKFPEGFVDEDLYFHYVSLVNTNMIYIVNGSNYHYVSRDSSICNTNKNKDIEVMKIYSLVFDYFNEHNLLNNGVKIFAVWPFFKIDNEEKYNFYKEYFKKIEEYLNKNKNIYNELELFFAYNIINTKTFDEYIKKFGFCVTMSFLRRNNGILREKH